MSDERHDFAQARVRLEEIVAQVRKKDTSLERSLDLLEEGVRLANICTELSDHTEWRTVIAEAEEDAADPDVSGGEEPAEPASGDEAAESGEPVTDAEDAATDASEQPADAEPPAGPVPEGPLGDDAEEPSSAE